MVKRYLAYDLFIFSDYLIILIIQSCLYILINYKQIQIRKMFQSLFIFIYFVVYVFPCSSIPQLCKILLWKLPVTMWKYISIQGKSSHQCRTFEENIKTCNCHTFSLWIVKTQVSVNPKASLRDIKKLSFSKWQGKKNFRNIA